MMVDLDLKLKYPSAAHRAVQVVSRKDILAEELRILYVALTRAREKIILVGSAANLTEQCRVWSSAARLQGWLYRQAFCYRPRPIWIGWDRR